MVMRNESRPYRWLWALAFPALIAACNNSDGQSGTDAQDVGKTDDGSKPSPTVDEDSGATPKPTNGDSTEGDNAADAGEPGPVISSDSADGSARPPKPTPDSGAAGTGSASSGPSGNGGSGGGPEGGGGGTPDGQSGSGGSAGVGPGGPPDAGSNLCPAEPPQSGTSCEEPWMSTSGVGLVYAHCSWGEDPRPFCRTTATCSGETWVVTTPTDARCEQPALGDACPTQPATVGSECTDATVDCWYPQGDHCSCSECEGGSQFPICRQIDPPQWACTQPPSDCPAQIPQAGDSCDVEGASCGPDCELQVTCEGGVWQWNQGICPICAAPTTPIATPSGDRDIASLEVGDVVYSVHRGAIEAVPVIRRGSTPVTHHQVMRVTLADGAVLEISPGHPTADGRHFGDLKADTLLDAQHEVLSVALVPYAYDRTYDVLPASDTGTYFAAGALIGSSLFEEDSSAAQCRNSDLLVPGAEH